MATGVGLICILTAFLDQVPSHIVQCNGMQQLNAKVIPTFLNIWNVKAGFIKGHGDLIQVFSP